MLTIIRNVVVCQSMNVARLNSLIRLTSSLQPKHKDESIKAKEFVFDPNLVKAFDKIRKGDLLPPIVESDTVRSEKNVPPTKTKWDSSSMKRESLREHTLGKLVYTGKLDKPFKAAKSLSLASSIGGAVCYPVMLPRILQEASLAVVVGYTIISATFVLLTPSLIQLISKRYLTTLYYHEQTETFTGYYKNFFMLERQIKFRAENVEVPPITGMFTSMLVNNKPYFVNHEDFDDKELLKKMLGYDKEFDFSKYTKDIEKDDDDDDDTIKDNNRTKSTS